MAAKEMKIVPFPFKGLNKTLGFQSQPENTTSDCENVRPYDTLDDKLRGGSRSGLSKYFSTQVNGSNAIQAIAKVTKGYDPSDVTPSTVLFSDDFDSYTAGDDLDDKADWDCYQGSSILESVSDATNTIKIFDDGTGNLVAKGVPDSTVEYRSALCSQSAPSSGVYTVSVDINTNTNEGLAGIILRANEGDPTSNDCYRVYMQKMGSGRYLDLSSTTTGLVASEDITIDNNTTYTLRVNVNGNAIGVYLNGGLVISANMTALTSQGAIGVFSLSYDSGDALWTFDNFSISAATENAAIGISNVCVVSGGNVYVGTKDDGLTNLGTGPSSGSIIGIQDAYQKAYICDGLAGGYKIVDPKALTIADWTPTDGDLPVGGTGDAYGARYITLYRGRIVLYGLPSDPQNWFMSAVGDPLDWDYSPATTTATRAIAGNNSDAGKLADILTCCAPYSDDLMIMGGDHTLWVMRGDPAAGGVIDSISYQTGIAGPKAFCIDPDGTMYFLGSGKIWRMPLGSTSPEPITRGRIDSDIADIDLTVYSPIMVYDSVQDGFYLFLKPITEPTTAPKAYFWDRRSDGFWKDRYPATMGPASIGVFDSVDPDDRAVLFGGWDGYVREIDEDATTDDGTAISSYCWMTPIASDILISSTLSNIRSFLDNDSGDVTAGIYTAKDVETMYESAAKKAITMSAGRNGPYLQRYRGPAIGIKLSSTTQWAMESLSCFIEQGGRHKSGVI